MVDSYVFTSEDKRLRRPDVRKPLELVPTLGGDFTPEVFEALDTPDNYDVAFGKNWVFDVNPAQTIAILRKARQQLMAEVNKIQKEIDRISILELPYTDPKTTTPWPRYYELRARKERER